jgi:hypothetical protein
VPASAPNTTCPIEKSVSLARKGFITVRSQLIRLVKTDPAIIDDALLVEKPATALVL